MRYHTEKPLITTRMYGEPYICDHPVYNSCTLFKIGDKGLAVIQQRYDPRLKHTEWTSVDPWLNDILYLNPGFRAFFEARAVEPINELYPTVTVRQLMWALRMKPLKREPWETYFDRKLI